jgi:hypothetical protein
MLILAFAITTVSGAFAPLVSTCVFEHTKLSLVGAMLAPCKRTMESVLHVIGKKANRMLLGLLSDAFGRQTWW